MTVSRLHAFLSAMAFVLVSSPAFAQPSNIDRLVTFGASLSDSGNAFIWLSEPGNAACGTPSNVPPYDLIEDLVPSGPYARGGHHFSNGATWGEQLARRLALAGNARPALRNPGTDASGMKASNYAVGGARAIAGYPCRFNLPDQVSAYLSDFPQTSAQTVVAIEIGGNDVRDALEAGTPTPYIADAVGSLAYNIAQLYAHGARRFLLLNVADVGKTPAVRLLDETYPWLHIAAAADQLSQGYNGALAGAVQQLMVLLPGIDLRVLDIYAILNSVVASPDVYGFTNVTDACISPGEPPFTCQTPRTYAFWDGVHPTEALHAIVAEQALAVIMAP